MHKFCTCRKASYTLQLKLREITNVLELCIKIGSQPNKLLKRYEQGQYRITHNSSNFFISNGPAMRSTKHTFRNIPFSQRKQKYQIISTFQIKECKKYICFVKNTKLQLLPQKYQIISTFQIKECKNIKLYPPFKLKNAKINNYHSSSLIGMQDI